jgi:hypothetical protein
VSKGKEGHGLEEQALECQFKTAATEMPATRLEETASLENSAQLEELKEQLKQCELQLGTLRSQTNQKRRARQKGDRSCVTASSLGILSAYASKPIIRTLFASRAESMLPPALVFFLCMILFLSAKFI